MLEIEFQLVLLMVTQSIFSELVSSEKYLVDSTWSNSNTAGKMETFLDIREVLTLFISVFKNIYRH